MSKTHHRSARNPASVAIVPTTVTAIVTMMAAMTSGWRAPRRASGAGSGRGAVATGSPTGGGGRGAPVTIASVGRARARSGSGDGAAEPAAVLGRAHAQRPQEGAAHGLRGPEPARGRDRRDGFGRLLEPAARRLDPHLLDVAGHGGADLLAEHAGQVARAHGRPLGQPIDRAVLGHVVGDPLLKGPHLVAIGQLGAELGAELGLVR